MRFFAQVKGPDGWQNVFDLPDDTAWVPSLEAAFDAIEDHFSRGGSPEVRIAVTLRYPEGGAHQVAIAIDTQHVLLGLWLRRTLVETLVGGRR